jgi:hypothetical protein
LCFIDWEIQKSVEVKNSFHTYNFGWTKVFQHANITFWRNWPAYILAEPHKKFIDILPQFPGNHMLKFNFCLLRSAGCNHAKTIGDPVDMGIHCNSIFAESVS